LSSCPVCLPCMSYLSRPVCDIGVRSCGQTVGQIKMKLGMQVGLGPGHIVLDGNPAPSPPKGHGPQFTAHVCCGQTAGWIKMLLGVEVGLGPRDFVLARNPPPPPQIGDRASQFSTRVHCG